MSENGYTPGLNVTIDHWAMRRGARLRIGVDRNGDVTAKVGEHVGRGRCSAVALEQLAGLLAEHEGWVDPAAPVEEALADG